MIKKSLSALSLAAAAALSPLAVHAQAAAPAAAPSTPAKKELVARILKIQQPGIEGMARSLVEQPAMELLSSAAPVLGQKIPKERQDAVAKDIQADVQKYLDDAVPLVQKRAVALAPAAIGALLEERFNEDELKQVAGFLESPVYVKFQRLGDEMQKSLVDKVVADTRPQIEQKVRALEATIGKRLGVAPASQGSAPAPQGGGAKAPAKK